MRYVWLGLGHVFVVLGMVGVFLPILPTVPFVLLAVACYSRGSARFERWLMDHPRFGPAIRDWRGRGVIRRRAKVTAAVMLLASGLIIVFLPGVRALIRTMVLMILAAAGVYVLSRPER